MRNLTFVLCLFLSVLLTALLAAPSARAECVPYPAFLHWVVDISNPWSPQLVGVLDRDVAYVSRIALLGTYAYVPHGGVLDVLDVSDPQSPREMGGTVADGHGVAVSGSRVLAAGGSSGLLIAPSQCEPAGLAGNTRVPEGPGLRVFPNPSRRFTTFRIIVPASGRVRAAIFDVGGHKCGLFTRGSWAPVRTTCSGMAGMTTDWPPAPGSTWLR